MTLLQGKLLACLEVADQRSLALVNRETQTEVARRITILPTRVKHVATVVRQLLTLNQKAFTDMYAAFDKAEEEGNDLDEDALWEQEYQEMTKAMEDALKSPILGTGHGVQAVMHPFPQRERDALMTAIDTLSASLPEKDYHPGSKDRVLDIVHPALYCYVKGVSPFIPSDRLHDPQPTLSAYHPFDVSVPTLADFEVDDDAPPAKKGLFENLKKVAQKIVTTLTGNTSTSTASLLSTPLGQLPTDGVEFPTTDRWGREFETSKYQWLPTYFKVEGDGTVIIEDYINGIPRRNNEELYSLLARLFQVNSLLHLELFGRNMTIV